MRARHEIGVVNGKPYKLVCDKRKNQMACDHMYRNEWRWFLWIDSDYQGDYKTKVVAIARLERSKENE